MIRTLREASGDKRYHVAERAENYENWYINNSHFDDDLYDDNCFTFGNRNFDEIGNSDAIDIFNLAYGDDTIPSFEDFTNYGGYITTEDEIERMSDDEKWQSYLDNIGMGYTSLYNDGKESLVKRIAEICKNRDYSDENNEEIGITLLNACLGGNWKITEIHGSVQGEWCRLCYDSTQLKDSDVRIIEMMCFNTYDSYVVSEETYTEEEIMNKEYLNSMNDITCDVFDWNNVKEELADKTGYSQSEIYIVDEY